MNFVRKHIGFLLISLGVVMLLAIYLILSSSLSAVALQLSSMVNAMLLISLCIIVIGVAVHVWNIKQQSRY